MNQERDSSDESFRATISELQASLKGQEAETAEAAADFETQLEALRSSVQKEVIVSFRLVAISLHLYMFIFGRAHLCYN